MARAVSPQFHSSRLISGACLLAADIVALLGCAVVIYMLRTLVWASIPLHWSFLPVAVSWLGLRLIFGLYPAFGMAQPAELRLSVLTSGLAMLSYFIVLLAPQDLQGYRLIGLGIWLLVVPASYFARSFARQLLIQRGYYCRPFVIIGAGSLARSAIREMQADPELGTVPVAAFGDIGRLRTPALEGVPVLGDVGDATAHHFPWPVRHVLIALSPQEVDDERIAALAAELAGRFRKVLILGRASFAGNLWARPWPFGPHLALEVQQTRFSPGQRRAKRAFDLLVSVPLLIAVAPVIGIAALAVKLASPGPAFFSQTREGMRRQPIRIYKLRTMVPDAEKRLTEHLAENPRARFEWEHTLKLRHDPRIIPRIGHFLRRSSIDELPQLFNIVRGDMSLVGPRIMPTREVERYSAAGQGLRRDVPPGLTGLWQVTSRSNSDLKVREIADSFYVSNWSVWLDAWILLRTIRVVLAGSGAY